MQNKTVKSIVKGAMSGIAVGTVVMLASNSKMTAGMSMKKNVTPENATWSNSCIPKWKHTMHKAKMPRQLVRVLIMETAK